jgi:anaerobic selenocysteine-containing dehydrogenase
MPKFKGEEDVDAYIDWELKVEKIFRIHNYSEEKKVAMASLEFEDYANIWWEDLQGNRAKRDEPLIDTWQDMKVAMYQRFVPDHYRQDLFNKLQNLKQGFKSVEEYYKEMEMIMMRGEVQELDEQTMARFLNGLNKPIKKIVDFQPYKSLVELLHQATKAERHVQEDIKYEKTKAYFAS